jgi:hypothetical protein
VDETLAVSEETSFPTWLRSDREFENFDFRCEFFIRGWTDSGIYLRAPEYGRPTWAGMQIKVFHQKEDTPSPQSMGAVFPVIPPKLVNVREGWNELRAVCDGPRLQVWSNQALIHDLRVDEVPALRYRLRRGYLGIVGASASCRFRNLRVKELPGTEQWTTLFNQPSDLAANWEVSEGKPDFAAQGPVLRSAGLGHLRTREKFKDFELQCYVRAASQHNSGILFRSTGRGLPGSKHYEIQLHNVEESHFPTGSLYHYKRAVYPRIQDGKWYLLQLRAEGKRSMVRIDGETVMEYDALDNLDEGYIELQAHRRGYWTEFKRIQVRRL